MGAPPEYRMKETLSFDILNLPKTIKRHREYLSRKPNDQIAHANLVMALDLAANVPVEKAQAERRRWYETHVLKFARGDSPHANIKDPERIIRIAYLSGDFKQHSAMYAVAPIIGHHDRTKFHVSAYSTTRPIDHYTQAIRGSVERFCDVLGWTDAQVAYMIEADRIDILVDCSGHTAGFRLGALSRKPAPIQISAFGYPLGTGLPQVDYLVSDPIFIPEAERGLYVEDVIQMPCFIDYQVPPYCPEVTPLPSLREGAPITFGMINRCEKLTDETILVWAEILRRTGGRMLVKDRHISERKFRRVLIDRFRRCGIPEEKLITHGQTHHLDQLRMFSEVDIQLDTWPQTGGISTAEALWMGVPVVTMMAPMPAGRSSASILSCIGHPEWVCTTPGEYIEKAVALAADRQALAALRAKLRGEVGASAFGNPEKYTRIFEEKLRAIWRAWCKKR